MVRHLLVYDESIEVSSVEALQLQPTSMQQRAVQVRRRVRMHRAVSYEQRVYASAAHRSPMTMMMQLQVRVLPQVVLTSMTMLLQERIGA